jgi:hypothetical protein
MVLVIAAIGIGILNLHMARQAHARYREILAQRLETLCR